MNTKKLIKNAIKCLKCNDVVESKHKHDFKWCKCGTVFVDGGLTYRRIGGDLSMIEDACMLKLMRVMNYESSSGRW